MGETFEVLLHTQAGILVGVQSCNMTERPGFVPLLLRAVLTDDGWEERGGELIFVNERIVDAIVYRMGTVGQENWKRLLHL